MELEQERLIDEVLLWSRQETLPEQSLEGRNLGAELTLTEIGSAGVVFTKTESTSTRRI